MSTLHPGSHSLPYPLYLFLTVRSALQCTQHLPQCVDILPVHVLYEHPFLCSLPRPLPCTLPPLPRPCRLALLFLFVPRRTPHTPRSTRRRPTLARRNTVSSFASRAHPNPCPPACACSSRLSCCTAFPRLFVLPHHLVHSRLPPQDSCRHPLLPSILLYLPVALSILRLPVHFHSVSILRSPRLNLRRSSHPSPLYQLS